MDPTAPRRLIAAFPDEQRARRAVARLREAGVAPTDIRLDDVDDRALVGRAGQRRESSSAVATPGVLGDERTMRAGWFHTFAWGAVGAVIGALIGLVVDLGWMATWAQVLFLAIIGALALGTAGFMFGLGRGPQKLPGPRPDPRQTVVSVEGPSTRVSELLRDAGAAHIQDADGEQVRTAHDQRVGRLP